MVSIPEQQLSRSLQQILGNLPEGAVIPDSKPFREVLTGLEWFLPEVFEEVYPEWQWLDLDGVESASARKTGDGEAEILGMCWLLGSQTNSPYTPIHVCLQVALSQDEVSWLECRIAERTKHGMVKSSGLRTEKALHALTVRTDPIDWVYKITFGQKRL
jgi:hypothetical protein